MADPDAVAVKAGARTADGSDRSILWTGGPSASGPPQALVAGVPTPSLRAQTCAICYESKTSYSALACGHPFCNECYADFLGHKIADEGHECFFARCPEPKCSMVVTPALVRSLVTDADKLRRYENAANLARSFVDDQPSLKWCPAPDCAKAVQSRAASAAVAAGSKRGFSVKCSCSHRFCFSCLHEDHAPASCTDLSAWTVKCRDDSETYNWLVANTKACPKCQTSIEKNGGCNHMTCKNTSCKYEFCWVCCGPWKDHSGSYYNCNKYDPDKDKQSPDGKKKDSSRQALERYLHYYTRYTNHDKSLKLETDNRKKMEQKIREMEQLGDNTWMDCQYLSEANEALHNCRYTLKFTYVYAFYLPREETHRLNFETQQAELENQTEKLSEMLERKVEDIDRMEVVHCYKMAEKRQVNLMELVAAHYGEIETPAASREVSRDAGGSSSDPIVVA